MCAECRIANAGEDYICPIGEPEITLPSTVDTSTGVRSFDIVRFILSCELAKPVRPSVHYNWIKDGVTLFRDLQRPMSSMVPPSDDFYMLGNNSLLLLIGPPPTVYVDFNFRLVVDFSLNPGLRNVSAILTMFNEGTTVEDLKRIIRNSALGNWTCTVGNSFGNDADSSLVSGECM